MKYPDVIPGPGLPSLAEIGVTSAELYNMDIPNSSRRSDTLHNVVGANYCGSGSAAGRSRPKI